MKTVDLLLYAGHWEKITGHIPWRERLNHESDCYFCVIKTADSKNKHKIQYPDKTNITFRHPTSSRMSQVCQMQDATTVNILENENDDTTFYKTY